MTDQLHRDLERRTGERLELWIKDTEELFEAGGFSSGHAHEAVIKQLVSKLCLALPLWTRGVSDEEFVNLFRMALHRARGRLEQEHYDRRAT